MKMRVLGGVMAIARLPPDSKLPAWVMESSWFSATRTAGELSIVCAAAVVPATVRQQGGWRLLEVEGPLDFNLTGILNRITAPMADAGISVFALSTFDTDYVMVREADLAASVSCLRACGIVVSLPE